MKMLAVPLLASLALSPVATAQAKQGDAVLGTWKLNVAKSKYDPGPAPKGSTLTFEAAGEGVKVTAKGQDAAGNPTSTEYTARYDGKDYPLTLVGTSDYDHLSLKRVDAFEAEGTRKKAAKVVQTYTRVVSPDGRTLTITVDGTDSKGRRVRNVIVYDKQ
jgi:hypothetical protein